MKSIRDISAFQVIERAGVLNDIVDPHGYNKSYQYFVKYFADGRELTETDLVIGANFAYGWMPTILKFKTSDFNLAVLAINEARSASPLSNDKMVILKSLINNSLVGASKLLHFINPRVYAIWDSRVCNFLLGKHNQTILSNIDVFNDYLKLCNRVISEPRFKDIHTSFITEVGYEMSKLRTVEQIMFHSSDRPLSLNMT